MSAIADSTAPSVVTVPTPSQALKPIKLKLPHPYLTEFSIEPSSNQSDIKTNSKAISYQVRQIDSLPTNDNSSKISSPLHRADFLFTFPHHNTTELDIPLSNNTPWARCQRAPQATLWWSKETPPTVDQVWLMVYSILVAQPQLEIFRLQLNGKSIKQLELSLIDSALTYQHPRPTTETNTPLCNDLVVSRASFWQGAASPFGIRSPWTPSCGTDYPKFQQNAVPRPRKPSPGTIVYSRYIPSLDEHFSLITIDYQNNEHVERFHKWQNDPRVAKGWNETGTFEEHKAYLKRQHDDPHTLTVFGRFNDTCFSYFELYWAKEDHVGLHYDVGDFDRGRHSLVGDSRYRGRHRVLAWWSCIIHYLFLDDQRTNAVIGEPISTNNQVLIYDYTHGLYLEKYIDFPHKRAALVKVTRERFFQLCPLNQTGGFVAGTGLPLPSKL